jgi:hypothetical protein
MLSFQPLAQVGRTREDLQGVSVSELWDRVVPVLASYGLDLPQRGPLRFGHPDCTRIEAMGVYERTGERPRLFPIVRDGNADDAAIMKGFIDRGFGGINFRDDLTSERVCRILGILLKAPGFFLGTVPPWLRLRLRAMDLTLNGLIRDVVKGRAKLGSFSVVSHHFMSPAELATDTGKERLEACVFRLSVNGEMVPMCRVNAGGLRDTLYAGAAGHAGPVSQELLEIRAS